MATSVGAVDRQVEECETCLRTVEKVQHDMQKKLGYLEQAARVGHTALTHGYLMDNDIRQPPPPCPSCNTAVLTVAHIISHCIMLKQPREEFLGSSPTVNRILADETLYEGLIDFLKHINAYELM